MSGISCLVNIFVNNFFCVRRHYRPLYLPMANLPVCNLRSAAPCSPFLEQNDKVDPGKKTKVNGYVVCESLRFSNDGMLVCHHGSHSVLDVFYT